MKWCAARPTWERPTSQTSSLFPTLETGHRTGVLALTCGLCWIMSPRLTMSWQSTRRERERESLTFDRGGVLKPEARNRRPFGVTCSAGPSSIKALYFQYVNWTNWLLSLCRFGTLVVGALSGPYDSLPSSNFDTRRRQRNVSSSSGLNEVSTAALLIYLFIYLFILTYIYIYINHHISVESQSLPQQSSAGPSTGAPASICPLGIDFRCIEARKLCCSSRCQTLIRGPVNVVDIWF